MEIIIINFMMAKTSDQCLSILQLANRCMQLEDDCTQYVETIQKLTSSVS